MGKTRCATYCFNVLGNVRTFVCGACIVRLSAHTYDISNRAPESMRSATLVLGYNKHTVVIRTRNANTVRGESERILGKDWTIIGSQVQKYGDRLPFRINVNP